MGIKRIGLYLAAILIGLFLAAAFIYAVPAVPPPLVYEQF
jgi:hypothetical protein